MSDWPEVERLIEQGREEALAGPIADDDEFWRSVNDIVAAADFPDHTEIAKEFLDRFLEDWREHRRPLPAQQIIAAATDIVTKLWRDEELGDVPPPKPVDATAIEVGEWRDQLLWMRKRAQDPQQTKEIFFEALLRAFSYFARQLPALAHFKPSAPAPFQIPIADLMQNLPHVTEEMLNPLQSPEAESLRLFHALDRNPFDTFSSVEIPFDISMQTRGEHTAIVAGSGHGKTVLINTIIAADLERDDPPGLIVVDSTGAIIEAVQRLAVFSDRLRERIVILDPKDDPAPALNLLDLNSERMARYSRRERQSLETEIVNLFGYIFSSVGTPLTSLMSGPFAYAVQLALNIPGATLDTVKEILEDRAKTYENAKHRDAIEALDYETYKPIVDYFRNRYYGQTDARRAQIADRIDAILKNTVIAEMLNARMHAIDFFEEMNKGSIILVNTSQEILRDDSTFFGRYVIARVMAAAFERAPILRQRRKQCFLIVDEAAPYFDDDQFPKLLTRIRQYGLGVVVAFQDLSQAGQRLQSAIAGSTAVKFAGGLGQADARWLGGEMDRDVPFMRAQQRQPGSSPRWTRFACYARGFTTDGAISLTIPIPSALDGMEKMSEAEHAELLERNRQNVTENYIPRVKPGRHQEEQPKPQPTQQSYAQPQPEPSDDPTTAGSEGASRW